MPEDLFRRAVFQRLREAGKRLADDERSIGVWPSLVAKHIDDPVSRRYVLGPQAGCDDSVATSFGWPRGHRSFHNASFVTQRFSTQSKDSCELRTPSCSITC